MSETNQSIETITMAMKKAKEEYEETESEYNYMALTYRMKLDALTSEYNKLLYQKTKLMDETHKLNETNKISFTKNIT